MSSTDRGARVVALISGRGSNLQALLDTPPGTLGGHIVGVISNVPGADGLARARAAGVATVTIDHRQHTSRETFDARLLREVLAWRADVVVLAGFMRILTDVFIAPLSGRLLNIHPSLLPALPGLHTHRRALAEGHAEHGATVHFVTAALDAGPAILRARVAVRPDDDESSLAARVLRREHVIYPLAVGWLCRGRLRLHAGAVQLDGQTLTAPLDLDDLHPAMA